jgi:hypothetical protein
MDTRALSVLMGEVWSDMMTECQIGQMRKVQWVGVYVAVCVTVMHSGASGPFTNGDH